MMGDDELVGLGLATSSCNNGNCFTKSLFSDVWHSSVAFSMTLVDLVANNFVVQEVFLFFVFFFFPLPNRSF